MGFLEERQCQYLVIHPEDEYDPDNSIGLLSLKVLAKQAGIGWQGRSLLIISPVYGPIHRLIAILTNMTLHHDEPIKNKCGECAVCIDKCPKKSLTLRQFDDHPNSREEVLDVQSCLGDDGCMVCILKCPYLKKNRTQVRCAHNGNDGVLEYWNDGMAPFGQIDARGGERIRQDKLC
jgi:epoxyqueuosine reductase QueG